MDAETLKRLYYGMLRIRVVEEEIANRYTEQEMRCPTHLCVGQEAVAVGVCDHLTTDDYAMSTHRSHGHYLAKGGDLKALLGELYGRDTGCARGKGGSMHLIDLEAGFLGATPIVGSTIPIAVGAAFGSMMNGQPELVSVVFFGDAATEEGVFHEAMNFAALKRLPVIFVCENNLYSVYSPLAVRQPAEHALLDQVASYGIEAQHGDGNDVMEVHRLMQQAVSAVRAVGGPAFLECDTYRWREHCGPYYDNDLGYREVAEFEEWRKRDPIEKLYKHLLANDLAEEQELKHMESDLQAEVDEAFAFATQSPFPDERLLNEHVFAP